MLRACSRWRSHTAEREHGVTDVKSDQRERRVRGRDAVGPSANRSRGAPGDQQDEDEQRRHPESLHAPVPARKTRADTCGEP